jgi:hypothetical protein
MLKHKEVGKVGEKYEKTSLFFFASAIAFCVGRHEKCW